MALDLSKQRAGRIAQVLPTGHVIVKAEEDDKSHFCHRKVAYNYQRIGHSGWWRVGERVTFLTVADVWETPDVVVGRPPRKTVDDIEYLFEV